MPGLLSGCRSGANFDSLPRGQRGSHAAIHKLRLNAAPEQQHDDFANNNGYNSSGGSSSSPTSPQMVHSGHTSQPSSPSKKAAQMQPVENLAAKSAAMSKIERARSSPFPQSAPASPNPNHPHAHSHHGNGAPSRPKHRVVDKRKIGLPTNFQHTGHIGRASYSAATSAMDSAAIKAQLSQVAAALNMDINLDVPAEQQVNHAVEPSEAIETVLPPQDADSAPSSPEMIPLPLSQPTSPTKRASTTLSRTSSPQKESKALPTPPSTSHGYAEASIRAVPHQAEAALPSPPIAISALPSASSSRHGLTPSTVSPASHIPINRPLPPRTAGPSQTGQGLRRKPVPRPSDFIELTPEEREAKDRQQAELEAQAVALQRRASSASAAKKLESLRKDMMGGLGAEDGVAGEVGPVPEEPENETSATMRVAPAQGQAQAGLLVPGGGPSTSIPQPSIGSQLLAPRLLPSNDAQSDPSSGLPRGTVRIGGKAFVEGPSGSLITRTANTRWNSALAEITAALASEGASADGAGLPPRMMSKQEEEALMLRMGIPLGPSDPSSRQGGQALPSETIQLKAELADAAHVLSAFEGEGDGAARV
ncbi:hypothetical protein A4X09_0g4585 [Tilletia walkeri]|uniref:CRIB domain-containing protein n=1 Tax=Tilletia walkeri TaxID=117179 RepID=A0A8X7N5Y8_9BASI|nr:hypothetical protein A4X09_0g4585 [Tilletia walkeri]